MSTREEMKRFCNSCKKITIQTVKLYNPNKPEEGEVWECNTCKENSSWASEKLHPYKEEDLGQKFDLTSHDNNSFVM